MNILWIKPAYGFAVKTVLGAPEQAKSSMRELYETTRSPDSPVLIYITKYPKRDLGWNDRAGNAVGLAYVGAIESGKTIDDYSFDDQWKVGVPIDRWLELPTPLDLGALADNNLGPGAWAKITPRFQTGAPYFIGGDAHAALKKWLDSYCEKARPRMKEIVPSKLD